MASEITEHDGNPSPGHDDSIGNGNGIQAENRGTKRQRASAVDDDDDDDDKPGRERRKIEIKFIQDKSRRHITFSKRKAGIMKKVSPVASRCRRRKNTSRHTTSHRSMCASSGSC
jgi:pheromone receptor transcription factor